MTSYNKLVRDKIPEILDKKGISYEQRIASEDEYKSELIRKIQEEVQEFAEEESIEELADILEVLEALKGIPGYEDVENIRIKKREERGGFNERIILRGEKG